MKFVDETRYPAVSLSPEDLEYCIKHAKKMCDGASTYSFKNDKIQSEEVYFIGKVGELAVHHFLSYCEKHGNVSIVHTPFRDNYDKFNWDDDFIIADGKTRRHLEVRTKGRSVNPKAYYECCTDCIKPDMEYIFVSYNKKTQVVFLVGWADWDALRSYATITSKGSTNSNFKHKTTEFNIQIQHLIHMKDFTVNLNKYHNNKKNGDR